MVCLLDLASADLDEVFQVLLYLTEKLGSNPCLTHEESVQGILALRRLTRKSCNSLRRVSTHFTGKTSELTEGNTESHSLQLESRTRIQAGCCCAVPVR